MEADSKIFVAGGTGMVGNAIIRKLLDSGHGNIISNFHSRKPLTDYESGPRFFQLDLTRQADVQAFLDKERPEYVFMAAAKVGGILANRTYPADFIYTNLVIETNVVHGSYRSGVRKLLFLGSSCIYPKGAPQPMKEEYLLTGELEPTNEPYAVAKIAGIKLCESYNRQYGTNFISVMPTNLYGPHDNFDLETSHVLPAMIRKFHEAKLLTEQPSVQGSAFRGQRSDRENAGGPALSTEHSAVEAPPPVVLWGSGSPYREFLHVDDLADACVFIMNNYNGKDILNIGTGEDLTIRQLAGIVKKVIGYAGETVWDATKPDGTPRKLLDISRIRSLGWSPRIGLEDGIRMTYDWYRRKTENIS